MKYYVFIARDEEEFSRYPGLRGGFHEKTPGFLKSVRYIGEDGYCVLILPHEAKNVDADGNVDVRRMCTNVAAAINGIGHKYNDADKILEVMSSVFGVYYTYSYSLLKEESCVNKLINSLHISNKNISKFFYQVSNVMNMYIDRKIGG
jgi:hypothetical protein